MEIDKLSDNFYVLFDQLIFNLNLLITQNLSITIQSSRFNSITPSLRFISSNKIFILMNRTLQILVLIFFFKVQYRFKALIR